MDSISLLKFYKKEEKPNIEQTRTVSTNQLDFPHLQPKNLELIDYKLYEIYYYLS